MPTIARSAVILCAIVTLLIVAQRDRSTHALSTTATALMPNPSHGHADLVRAKQELRETELRLAAAREDLAAAIARLDERKQAIASAENKKAADPGRPAAVMDDGKQERERLEADMAALQKRADQAESQAKATRAELAKLRAGGEGPRIDNAQRPAAAPMLAGDPNGLGRGAIVDQQTKFHERRFRDPSMPAFTSDAAATAAAGSGGARGGGGRSAPGSTAYGDMLRGQSDLVAATGEYNLNTSQSFINLQTAKTKEMENRLRWTETFFEMRRINRTNRALEAGPRPTMEQIVKYARMQAPRRLTSLELDPVTGEIRWPRVLTDTPYKDDRDFLQEQFRLRANNGGSVDYAQFETMEAACQSLAEKLRGNVSKYPPAKYGEARTFLDSLKREYELPLN